MALSAKPFFSIQYSLATHSLCISIGAYVFVVSTAAAAAVFCCCDGSLSPMGLIYSRATCLLLQQEQLQREHWFQIDAHACIRFLLVFMRSIHTRNALVDVKQSSVCYVLCAVHCSLA